jgi:hypothetical protein
MAGDTSGAVGAVLGFERCRSLGPLGGGRKAAVPLEDAGGRSTLTSTSTFPGQSEDEVALGRSWSRMRLRTRKWLPGPTVDGLLRGRRALPVGMAGHGHLVKKVEFPPPTPARIVMVLCWVMVYSGGPAVALALAGRARAVPLVRSRRASVAGRKGRHARRSPFAGRACWEGPSPGVV